MSLYTKGRLYEIYRKPDGDEEELFDSLIAVKIGFSLPAFLPFIQTGWYLMHRLWVPAIGITAAMVASYYFLFSGQLPGGTAVVLRFGIMFFSGFLAHDFLSDRVRRDGYSFESVEVADSDDEAKMLFLRRHIAEQNRATHVQAMPVSGKPKAGATPWVNPSPEEQPS